MPVDEIAHRVGCSVATVYNSAHRTGCPVAPRRPGHRWTADQDAQLRELFPILRSCDLEAHFGLTFEQIRTRAKRLGVRSRQALALAGVRHDAFGQSTPEAAYFAGLIAADGWVIEPKNAVHLALKVADRAMVDRFAAFTGASRDVRVYRSQVRATACSENMVADLRRVWNIGAAKTRTLLPPPIEDRRLQLAYVAGHMDGDGFISGRMRSDHGALLRCGAMGTEAVIRWISSVLDEHLASIGRDRPVRVRQLRGDKYSFPMFEWRTSDHNAVVILDAMREVIGDLGIRRKWATFETYRAVLTARKTTQTKGAAA